jgi:hypothetical protein
MPLDANGNNSNYVGDLMIYIGDRVNMVYSSIVSFANIDSLVFQENGMQYSQSNYDYITVSSCLDCSKPVIITAAPNNSNLGHAWIIDGKITRTNYYTTTEVWHELVEDETIGIAPPGTYYYTDGQAHMIDPYVYDGKTTITYSSITNNYLRMNWGYDGLFDNAEYSSAVYWRPSLDMSPFTSNATIYYNFTN